MKVLSLAGSTRSDSNIEILSEEEEYYIGVVRNILECTRRDPWTETDLSQVEYALLAAGASRMAHKGGREVGRFVIRGVQFVLSRCAWNVHKIELRFVEVQQ